MKIRFFAPLLLLLTLCSGARATWALVNSSVTTQPGAVTAGNPGVTPALSVTAKNMIAVAVLAFAANGGNVSSCTDTAGDTLAVVPGSQIASGLYEIEWWAGVTAGNAANVVSCRWTQNVGNYDLFQLQYSGNGGVPGNTGAGAGCTGCLTPITSSAFSPRNGDLILGVLLVSNGGLGFTPGSGYTDTGVHDTTTVAWIEANTGMNATAGSQTATAGFTGGGSTNVTFSVATFSLPPCTQVGGMLVGP